MKTTVNCMTSLRWVMPTLLALSLAACDSMQGAWDDTTDWLGFEEEGTASRGHTGSGSGSLVRIEAPSPTDGPEVASGSPSGYQPVSPPDQSYNQPAPGNYPTTSAPMAGGGGGSGMGTAAAYPGGMAPPLPGQAGGYEEPYPGGGRRAEAGTQQDLTEIAGDRLFFPSGSVELTPKAHEVLVRQADWLRHNPNVMVMLIGHADERGSSNANLILGQRRADAAKRYLVALGIEPRRIETVSFGDRKPFASGGGEASNALNRRVVMAVVQR